MVSRSAAMVVPIGDEKKNFAKAIDIIQAARSRQPTDDRLTQNLVYGVQEWARETQDKEGDGKAKAY